ncbi:MAG: hypothetical protein H6835_10175 [Planctomycetes bacterium]|nr:hypothetical protein [Planctomycetota bacterium]
MAKTQTAPSHRWSFYRAGGVDQVRLDKGADILNLDKLDKKLWVALSCPVKGLEIDTRMLELLDADDDGYVRPPEVLAAVAWLRDVLQNADELAAGVDGVALANIRKDTAEGKAVFAAAAHALKSLGGEAKVLTVADSVRVAEIFAKAQQNGDGTVPPAAIADEKARAVAVDVVACMGGVADRSGDLGYDQAQLDAFFAACAAYDAWQKEGEAGKKDVMPFGADTPAAHAAFTALRAKIDDYFGRCRLASFDPRALAAVNREEAAYIAAAAKDLTITADEMAHFPLALVEAGKPLDLEKGINPAWAAQVTTFRALCCGGKASLDEAGWAALCARFAGYEAWLGKKAGGEVEKLGVARVREILAGKHKDALQQAIADDLALAGEFDAMVKVEKLARLHHGFARLLNNYISFTDFYSRKGAIFQAGTLFLDGRALDLCFHVNDAGKHGTLAPMAKTYLAYCDCTRPGEPKMQVACAFTAGDSDNLFVGRNGIFYDRKGRDWNATIVKIVDNPISVRQAFWSPYKKLIRWIEETVAKRAAAADSASTAKLQETAGKAGDAAATGKAGDTGPKKMDIGVLAAISVAISGITMIVGTMLEKFFSLGYLMPLGLVGLMLLISGPAMLIAWMKLRQRNLGPILDANGWAVNTLTRVNIPLGGSLTGLPRIPEGANRSLVDPYAPKKSIWPRLLLVLLLLAGTGYGLYRTNLLHKWLPDWVPAHHTELALELAEGQASAVPQGGTAALVVASGAAKLQVVDVTDTNKPVALDDLAVADGKAVLTVPADMAVGTKLKVIDAVGEGTFVEFEVVAKPQ